MMNNSQTDNPLKSAYQHAARFQNALNDMSTIAKNTTLAPHWIGKSDCFWYRRETQVGVEFRLVNAKEATNQVAFDHQVLAAALADVCQQDISADNLPMTYVNITLHPRQVHFLAFDQHYCFDNETGHCQAVTPGVDLHSIDRLVSPDGKKIAFARDYNLWVKDIETGEESALTQDGEQRYSYATSPVSWGVSLGIGLQACWSPDSNMLFTVQTDNRQVKCTPVTNYVPQDGSVRPVVTEYPIGYPGDEHVEEQRLLVIQVETRQQQSANYRRVHTNRGGYGFIGDNLAWWSKDSQHAYFVDMERGDQIARVVEFDTYCGDTNVLFEDTSETYLNLSPCEATAALLLPLPDSEELIWYSERTGWGHLYLYDLKTGHLKRPVTEGEWGVREVLHFDAENRELWIQTGGRVEGRNPYYLDICRVNIDTGKLIALTDSDHEYSVFGSLGPRTTLFLFRAYIDPDGPSTIGGISVTANYVVATCSRADQAPVNVLLDRNGKQLLEVERSDMSGLPANWQWPESVELLGADKKTDIYGTVFRPSDFSPDKQYPVIDCSLCIPEITTSLAGSFSNAPLGGVFFLKAAALAELGFIVVTIDGRGTPFRGRSFLDTSYGWVPSANRAEDRMAGINQLGERYPYMDLDRVGIVAFNGTVGAVYGMLEHPEFYKVGVSQSLQDARVMASIWGELYEGIESQKASHRHAEELVDNLQGKLLLIQGLQDRMDHSAATWRLVHALQLANKDFDMLILPNEGSRPEDGEHLSSPYAYRRAWDYFVAHLQCVDPPKEFDTATVATGVNG